MMSFSMSSVGRIRIDTRPLVLIGDMSRSLPDVRFLVKPSVRGDAAADAQQQLFVDDRHIDHAFEVMPVVIAERDLGVNPRTDWSVRCGASKSAPPVVFLPNSVPCGAFQHLNISRSKNRPGWARRAPLDEALQGLGSGISAK